MDNQDFFRIRVVAGALALIPTTAFAQVAPPPASPEAAPTPGSTEAAPVAAAPEPEAAPAPVAEAPAAPPEEQPAEAKAEEKPAETPIDFSIFADAYVTWQTAKGGTEATRSGHRAYAGQGPNFLAENGFSLSWLGLDASYSGEKFGVTGSLRFGTAVPKFHGNDPAIGIDNLVQAYATWKPVEAISLDLGQFGTIFGAEVAESWHNLNYTRGALYYYGQPFWHTGLRAGYQISDTFKVTGMLVNGTNNISETLSSSPPSDEYPNGIQGSQGPTGALQISASNDTFLIAAGGMWAFDPKKNTDGGFDQFYDLVGTLSLGDLSVVLNADYKITKGTDGADDTAFFGVSGAVGYSFTDFFGIALRGEYLKDDANYDGGTKSKWNLLTGTLTLDAKPVPGYQNVILRWDNRIERSNQNVFNDGDGEPTKKWFATVLGLVVTSAP